MWALLAGGLVLAAGLGLVWAASGRRTVRVAFQDVPARGKRAAVRVRVRYDFVDGHRADPTRPDIRDILGRLTRAVADERAKELEGLLTEARDAHGLVVHGFEIEKG